ncbi:MULTISPECIES: cyclic nucleotide-binding domain-containing protein [unclassified Methylobacterium]|uniref:cyclic nucleotide-binding domain-containing protein n=1 Tax=unclassified Methylobacterium TaxID=2615210 RepID=UPI001354809E|nr:cyclic nucleotide-binding domain-containing protein [Methylobacterium sp. 2A]MWV23243.1 cyclic nucleotide-binding domain-containing protein [Methylobacterium sp. 2A]
MSAATSRLKVAKLRDGGHGPADGRPGPLSRHTMEHALPAGTVLFEQGEVPNFQVILISGSVQLFGRSADGREVLIEVVRAPDLLIPAAVLTGSPYPMQARVPEPSRFLLVQADPFRDAIDRDPHLARSVLGTLAEQFRRMVRQTKNLKLRSAAERVGCYLLVLSERQGTPGRALLPYEKHVIASELDMTRESFSRALNALTKSGIAVDGQEVAIHDRARLAQAAMPDPLIDPPVPDDAGRQMLDLIGRVKG